jgi:hypothetical protein
VSEQAEGPAPLTKFLGNIDHENLRAVMRYYQFEDYDDLLRCALKIRERLLHKRASVDEL